MHAFYCKFPYLISVDSIVLLCVVLLFVIILKIISLMDDNANCMLALVLLFVALFDCVSTASVTVKLFDLRVYSSNRYQIYS